MSTTAVPEYCAKCGGILENFRCLQAGELYHLACTAPVPSDIDGPAGETGGTDELVERANNGHNDPTLCRALAAALTSLRAERDELKELVQRNYSLWFSEKMRAEAAESSLAAERLKVAKLTADCVTWRKTFDRIEQEAAKDAQRVAALVGALLWIDNTDPEIVAAAEEKFGFKLATEA